MMNIAPAGGISGTPANCIHGSPYRSDDRSVLLQRKEMRAWPFAVAAVVMGSAQALLFHYSLIVWAIAAVLLWFFQVKHALVCAKNREIREENSRLARQVEGAES